MKRTTILVWLLCLACVMAATVQLIVRLRTLWPAPDAYQLVEVFGWGWSLPVVFSITAAVIITQEPRNRVGWLLMIPALFTAFSTDQLLATPRTELTPALWLMLWVNAWSWIPVIFPVILMPLHFPSGRPPSPRWRWVNWLAIAMWIFFMFFVAFGKTIGPLNYDWSLSNPIGFLDLTFFGGPVGIAWIVGLVAMTLGSLASLIVRYRRAGLVEKEQIKWLLYAAALFGIYYSALAISNPSDEALMSTLSNLIFVLTILAFPIAMAIAILRYHLFDIDVIIRKTAVYGVLTILLGLVYFGVIVLLQTLFESVTGEQSPLILVVSTLLIAFLFAPLRRWVQGVIDRRFYRSKYDAQRVLQLFAQTARDETDLEQLTGELVTVLQETLQPQAISLWTAEAGGAPGNEVA